MEAGEYQEREIKQEPFDDEGEYSQYSNGQGGNQEDEQYDGRYEEEGIATD